MSIERIYRCDWRECEGHARTAAARAPAGFITVSEPAGGASLHFCTWDCVLRYAAEKPPVELVSLADD